MNTNDPDNIFINKMKIFLNKSDSLKKDQTKLLVKDFLNLRTLKEIEVITVP